MVSVNKKFSIISLCLFGLACLQVSCKDPIPVPIASVNFTTNIYANQLVNPGGYEYFTGAVKGLIVYRFDMETFYAYDRACSYDWRDGGYVSVNDSNSFQLICGTCRSTFNILNGYPVGDVKADAPLRQYRAELINDFNLRIFK
jgi:nitrite reductase/ring-hydroxylating ferredoxin subunit